MMLSTAFLTLIILAVLTGPHWTNAQSVTVYEKCKKNDCSGRGACVTIYQHRNFGGWPQCLTFQNDECVTLNSWWIDRGPRVSSLNSHFTCVRFFEDRGCTGRSIEINPNITSYEDLKQQNFGDMARSVSSCARSPGNDTRCSVGVLFSRSIRSEQVSRASTEILRVLERLGHIAAVGFSEVVPGLDAFYEGLQFVTSLFNSEMSREVLIDAQIDEALARYSASQVSAKIHVINRRLESVLARDTPDADRRIALKLALHSCEEVQQLFEDRGYAFRLNKLVSSPYLVAFSSVYLSVAKLVHEIRPELRERVTGDVRELTGLNRRFLEEALRQRKERLSVTGNWFTGYNLQDAVDCPREGAGSQSSCRRDRDCKSRSDCDRCLESARESADQQIENFFRPVISRLERFPN